MEEYDELDFAEDRFFLCERHFIPNQNRNCTGDVLAESSSRRAEYIIDLTGPPSEGNGEFKQLQRPMPQPLGIVDLTGSGEGDGNAEYVDCSHRNTKEHSGTPPLKSIPHADAEEEAVLDALSPPAITTAAEVIEVISLDCLKNNGEPEKIARPTPRTDIIPQKPRDREDEPFVKLSEPPGAEKFALRDRRRLRFEAEEAAGRNRIRGEVKEPELLDLERAAKSFPTRTMEPKTLVSAEEGSSTSMAPDKTYGTNTTVKASGQLKKHLTCWYWQKLGHCMKTAADCEYAHEDTGQYSVKPRMTCWYWLNGNSCHKSANRCLFAHEDTGWYSKRPSQPEIGEVKLKHLTCWFWNHEGKCVYSAKECRYAHKDTGRYADAPRQVEHGMPPVAGRNAESGYPFYIDWGARDFERNPQNPAGSDHSLSKSTALGTDDTSAVSLLLSKSEFASGNRGNNSNRALDEFGRAPRGESMPTPTKRRRQESLPAQSFLNGLRDDEDADENGSLAAYSRAKRAKTERNPGSNGGGK